MDNFKGRQTFSKSSAESAGVQPLGNPRIADLTVTPPVPKSPMFNSQVMEAVCDSDNLRAAYKRVIGNNGCSGVDGMGIEEFGLFLRSHLPSIKIQLLSGEYRPKPVRRVEIPKQGSTKKRKLGIPCVLDRFIQQALLQVLQPVWDKTFSDFSFGFRPGRSCHQAIAQAQNYWPGQKLC